MASDNLKSSEIRSPRKRMWAVSLSIVIIFLIVSASLNIYYYNLSNTEERNIEGATYETAFQFQLCTIRISLILQTDPALNNSYFLYQTLNWFLSTDWHLMRTLREYLLPNYAVQLRPIEVLLENMTEGGERGVSDTLYSLLFSNNTLFMQAYRELCTRASQKIADMGTEVLGAFSVRMEGDVSHAILEFHVDSSKIENATNICNDLKTILNTWELEYR